MGGIPGVWCKGFVYEWRAGCDQNGNHFASGYFCNKVLPKELVLKS